MARRHRGRQGVGRPVARVGAAAIAKSRRGDGAGLRAACRQSGTKSHGRPARHPDRGVRGRVNQHLTGDHMSTEIIFQIHLVLGYVAWLLCFGAYVWPWLKSMNPVEAQRAIATLHSFRFFGLVFLVPGVVGPNLPASFPPLPAHVDFATGLLAMLALLTIRIRPVFWLFVVAFNLLGAADILLAYYHAIQPDFPAREGEFGAVYAIPILYVPLLMITHFTAFYLLLRSQLRWTQAPAGEAAV